VTASVYLALYAGLLIFLAGCIRRIAQYARTPLHLRWELYPVPHEEPERAAHGGSYFEDRDWWSKPQKFNLTGELRAMVPEMLFLKGLWEFNRPLWYISFLFHFGLYLAIGGAVLAAAKAALALFVPAAVGGVFGTVLMHVYRIAGLAGTMLILAGAASLYYRRTTSAELKNYTTVGDLLNLASFIVTFAALALGYLVRPAGTDVSSLLRGLLTFDTSVRVGGLFAVGLVMAAALAAYIPYTHMAHFIAKYFTYHAVRWDDRWNLRGGAMEAKLAEYLTYRPNWSAAHMGADGRRTWAEIATTNPTQEVRK
jgi:nitrate reductase gamma subunit